MDKIPFNKIYTTGKELDYIFQATRAGKISGDGEFTVRCQDFFKRKFGFENTLFTPSCTDALELASLLLKIEPGDEVIMPSFTFVSTATPFVLRGAKIAFCDSRSDQPNLDENCLEALITKRTKAIVVVHYGGVACNMEAIMSVAEHHRIPVIEDAAQAVGSTFLSTPLGRFGAFSTFSFHETKNVNCGEGGMLVINDKQFGERAEIIREKGTNRSAFFRGQVAKYRWVDIGSSFLLSDINAAYLFAQLEALEPIQAKRIQLWDHYHSALKGLQDRDLLRLPFIPPYASNNAHLFYVICKNAKDRDGLMRFLQKRNIMAIVHYQSLHDSPFYKGMHQGGDLQWARIYTDYLLRLPLFVEMTVEQVSRVAEAIHDFFRMR